MQSLRTHTIFPISHEAPTEERQDDLPFDGKGGHIPEFVERYIREYLVKMKAIPRAGEFRKIGFVASVFAINVCTMICGKLGYIDGRSVVFWATIRMYVEAQM